MRMWNQQARGASPNDPWLERRESIHGGSRIAVLAISACQGSFGAAPRPYGIRVGDPCLKFGQAGSLRELTRARGGTGIVAIRVRARATAALASSGAAAASTGWARR